MTFPPQPLGRPTWQLTLRGAEPGVDLVGVGGELEPATVLSGYAVSLFPMEVETPGGPVLGWWSPDPRAVFPAGALTVRRSLRKVVPRFEIRIDSAFAEVTRACADPDREGGWITAEFIAAYTELHERGWAHSVETWQDGELVGGLYGVALRGLFAGESMFHRVRDASKVALVALDRIVHGSGAPDRLIDAQWATEHLRSLGCVEWSRDEYRSALRRALAVPDLDFGAVDPRGLLDGIGAQG